MDKKIGIIGFGNMGRAIGEQLNNVYEVYAFDKDIKKTDNLKRITVSLSAQDLLRDCDIIIIAVKPQDFGVILSEINTDLLTGKLVVSIAAGVSSVYIENILPMARVVRVVPNMPAKVGLAVSCLAKGISASQQDLDFTEELFSHLGRTLIIQESMMNFATAVYGSSPGFFYDRIEGKNKDEIDEYSKAIFIPGLEDAAVKAGLASSEKARELAENIVYGSIKVMEGTGLSPEELKRQVASKGGTTEAGLEVLHKGAGLQDAIKAAVKRAEELSK